MSGTPSPLKSAIAIACPEPPTAYCAGVPNVPFPFPNSTVTVWSSDCRRDVQSAVVVQIEHREVGGLGALA